MRLGSARGVPSENPIRPLSAARSLDQIPMRGDGQGLGFTMSPRVGQGNPRIHPGVRNSVALDPVCTLVANRRAWVKLSIYSAFGDIGSRRAEFATPLHKGSHLKLSSEPQASGRRFFFCPVRRKVGNAGRMQFWGEAELLTNRARILCEWLSCSLM